MGNDCLKSGPPKYKIAVICGSLRQKSCNRGLLQALIDTKHPQFDFIWVDIMNFPIFDQDIENKQIPSDVQKARKLISQVDAILFGVPQYNYSIASPLKNAYDWLSRQYPKKSQPWNKISPMQGKIGAMTSVGGQMGGGKAQRHFLQCVYLRKIKMLPDSGAGEMKIKRWGGNYFSDDGKIISKQLNDKLTPFLNTFLAFIKSNLATN